MLRTGDLCHSLKSKGECMAAIGTTLGARYGYEQLVRVEFERAKATSEDQNAEVIATAAAGMSAPKAAKRTMAAMRNAGYCLLKESSTMY